MRCAPPPVCRPLLVLTALLCALAGPLAAAPAAEAPPRDLGALADEQFAFAAQQYRRLLARLGDDPTRLPRSAEHGQLKLVPPGDWTAGFFPGALWLIFEQTQDPALRAAAENFTARLAAEAHNTTTHDLGFMLFCSYGQGLRLTQNPAYRPLLVQGARSLASRYRATTGLIRSWDFGTWQYPVIIDNLMNLELLLWAAQETGDATLRQIALRHADRTLAHHFRADGSSFHLVDYDPATGAVVRRQTVQGCADTSAWARGQGWGLYGYTTLYRYTQNPAYLAQARRIADFLRHHPRLPADGVPYWDFDAPDIPAALRDASAGAIMASALLELSTHVAGPDGAAYRALAERQLRTLSTAAFRANLGENTGFLLRHSVGHLPEKHEIDVPLAYADYYYLEALARWKRYYGPPAAPP